MRAYRKKQGELFAAPPARFVRQEPRHFYQAVLFLRGQGLTVLRISRRQSLVGDHLTDNKLMFKLAEALGWARG